MANVGTLDVQIGADIRDLKRAQREANAVMRTMSDNMIAQGKRAEMNVKRSFRGILTATGALVAGMAAVKSSLDIVKVGAQFEQSMAKVKAITKATPRQFSNLQKVARKMGETTEFSARQAAQGLTFLGMAGLTAEQSVKALPDTLNLATAAGLDLGRTADIVTNAMTSMRLGVKDLGKINDVFAKTITTSNTNMEGLAESFKFVAPLAAGMGFKIEEVAGLIGKLGSAGIQGSMAGTQLAFAMTKLNKVFKTYGESAKNADGSSKGLIDALELLEKHSASAMDVMSMFGARGGRAMIALMGQGSEAVRKYVEEVKNSEGATNKMADTMRNTTVGAFKALKSVIESVKIDAFSNDATDMRDALNDMTDSIRENKDVLIEGATAMVKMATAMVKLTSSFMNLGNMAGERIFGFIPEGDTAVQKLKSVEDRLKEYGTTVQNVMADGEAAANQPLFTDAGQINYLLNLQSQLKAQIKLEDELLQKQRDRGMALTPGIGSHPIEAPVNTPAVAAPVPVPVTPVMPASIPDPTGAVEVPVAVNLVNVEAIGEQVQQVASLMENSGLSFLKSTDEGPLIKNATLFDPSMLEGLGKTMTDARAMLGIEDNAQPGGLLGQAMFGNTAEGDPFIAQLDTRSAAMSSFADTMVAANEFIAKHTAAADKRAAASAQKLGQDRKKYMGKMWSDLASLQNSKSKKMQKVGQAVAIAETVVNTGKAAMGAYSALAGIPIVGPALGAAAAAAAIAAGVVQIQNIKSASPGGGSVGGGGISAGASIPSAGDAPGVEDFEESTGTDTSKGRIVNFYNYGTVADQTQLAREQSEFLIDADQDGVNRF